jgi:DNA-binding MarR family transcriptional regulator
VYLTDKSKKLEPHIRELQQRWVRFLTQDMTESEVEVFAGQLRLMANRAREINA